MVEVVGTAPTSVMVITKFVYRRSWQANTITIKAFEGDSIKIMKLTKEQLLGIVRHGLTFVGGLLLMKGLVDEAILSEISGAVITLTGAIWSIINKKQA